MFALCMFALCMLANKHWLLHDSHTGYRVAYSVFMLLCLCYCVYVTYIHVTVRYTASSEYSS